MSQSAIRPSFYLSLCLHQSQACTLSCFCCWTNQFSPVCYLKSCLDATQSLWIQQGHRPRCSLPDEWGKDWNFLLCGAHWRHLQLCHKEAEVAAGSLQSDHFDLVQWRQELGRDGRCWRRQHVSRLELSLGHSCENLPEATPWWYHDDGLVGW